MLEGRPQAVQADEDVVRTSLVRELVRGALARPISDHLSQPFAASLAWLG
jgi:hypothetical protein